MKLRALAAVFLLASWPATAVPQETTFMTLLRAPGTLDSLAQEIGMKISGARLCRVNRLLPAADIATILNAMRKVDPTGVELGLQRAEIIARGVGLRPGSAACKIIAQKISESRPLYAQMAEAATSSE